MIAIEIPETGKTVFKTVEEWLSMTDTQYQDMVANNEGYQIDHPFVKILDHIREDQVSEFEIPETPEEISPEEFKSHEEQKIKKG